MKGYLVKARDRELERHQDALEDMIRGLPPEFEDALTEIVGSLGYLRMRVLALNADCRECGAQEGSHSGACSHWQRVGLTGKQHSASQVSTTNDADSSLIVEANEEEE